MGSMTCYLVVHILYCHYMTPLQHRYNTTEEAVEQVREGKAWVAICIPEDYTKDICQRAFDSARGHLTPEIINGSTVHLYMDVTSMEFHIRTYCCMSILLCLMVIIPVHSYYAVLCLIHPVLALLPAPTHMSVACSTAACTVLEAMESWARKQGYPVLCVCVSGVARSHTMPEHSTSALYTRRILCEAQKQVEGSRDMLPQKM